MLLTHNWHAVLFVTFTLSVKGSTSLELIYWAFWRPKNQSVPNPALPFWYLSFDNCVTAEKPHVDYSLWQKEHSQFQTEFIKHRKIVYGDIDYWWHGTLQTQEHSSCIEFVLNVSVTLHFPFNNSVLSDFELYFNYIFWISELPLPPTA